MNTTHRPTTPRIVIADDSALLREGMAGLLTRRNMEVIATAASATELEQLVEKLHGQNKAPDLVIADVRMPPTMTDDGLRAAVKLRSTIAGMGVLIVSQYVAPAYARTLLESSGTGGLGYLLKDRVSDVVDFLRTIDVVVSGGVVVDTEVTGALVHAKRTGLSELTAREREVLGLMAQGMANQEIAGELVVSAAAVAKHVSNIFSKLHLEPGTDNRRVRAILTYLTDEGLSGR
ncbi:LuxR C-terminal-related transcriptional regulator [Corynebacterium mendelii]|uniref:Response regulator transcription factor n=1 Tax=Corynebacterium mendelii TaxID=2765362 RepID=A0A939E1V4_9CORY|nr:response regulator transcription factor [Corynebacterium mendelii]MBN9645178.1 response regulator transcription factor [Corynebacterium mendelii]